VNIGSVEMTNIGVDLIVDKLKKLEILFAYNLTYQLSKLKIGRLNNVI
jgi:hypothetical protein